jgi:cobalt-precorrin-7 (C5)-methyltransferase
MEGRITVVGTGPGHPDYLTNAGAVRIAEASVVIGGRRLLESFARPAQKQFVVDKNLNAVVAFIEEHYRKERLVVLVSGDTGIYSLASFLAKKFPPGVLEFIPGVSSVQLMFARLKKTWQNTSIISLHGRPPEGLFELVSSGTTVAVLTDNHFTPGEVAAYLVKKGCPDLPVAVGKNLSYENEEISMYTLHRLAEVASDPTPAVVVIEHE